ncbi:MAG: NFACT RNA binding domain-containing protein [Cyanobacteria bacterium P01_E01_bin.6]
MQTVDFTTLIALCTELRQEWVPARLENVYQRDRHTISMSLRTLKKRGWLTLSWHPQAARLCIDDPPPRYPDTFTFSQQLRHQLSGLALVNIVAIAPWERSVDLQFANRPGDSVLWHVYLEVMGKYSNVILTTHRNQVITAAQQVGDKQSSVRSIQTGQPYEPPPSQSDAVPSLEEPMEDWHERLALVPGPLWRNLVKLYRGVSPVLARSLAARAGLEPTISTDMMSAAEWEAMHTAWQQWLHLLNQNEFQAGWQGAGYTVTGWGHYTPEESVQRLVSQYYKQELTQQELTQCGHQLTQKLDSYLKKLYRKAADFQQRLQASEQSDELKQKADLLMAYQHQWQPGMKTIMLPDFETGAEISILLDPTKNGIQNAQKFYKKHQKTKRSRTAVLPLLQEAEDEIRYLEQVDEAIVRTLEQASDDNLAALYEIRDELIQQGYLNPDQQRQGSRDKPTNFYHYQSPSGFDILIGRNNRQNDELTFRLANDYDIWFHTQEIPGSHVLLRLPAGQVADDVDLQCAADLAAHYSRARQSEQAPVIYTAPKLVFKPKGAKPGMVIYKQETVIWGYPQKTAKYNSLHL